jgi:hypothetical protein
MTRREKEEIIKHNKDIISFNINFRIKRPHTFSEPDIDMYRKQRRRELSKLRRFMESGGVPVLNKETGFYTIPVA